MSLYIDHVKAFYPKLAEQGLIDTIFSDGPQTEKIGAEQ